MKSLTAFLGLLLSFTISAQELYLPESDDFISHPGFSLEYSEEHEQALWVAYELTDWETQKRYERSDHFVEDPKVESGSASAADYKGSGYDRGHLAPAADLSWSSTSMQASFYYSNMSPQQPGFNRGIWKKLEAQVRQWAVDHGAVQVTTGPIFTPRYASIGYNEVAVPQYYYKVVLYENDGQYEGIGLILPHQKSSSDLRSFVYTIDEVEARTGLDFFYQLPDSLEAQTESAYSVEAWSWTVTADFSSGSTESTAQQCKGTTLKGLRCKNRTKDPGGFCHHHVDQAEGKQSIQKSSTAVRCSGTTQLGKRCKRMTKDASGRCWQH